MYHSTIDGCLETSGLLAMKTFVWNVCGLGNSRACRRLRQMLRLHNPQLVFFMETKVDQRVMETIRRKSGFFNGIDISLIGTSGGLYLAWKGESLVSLRSYSKCHIDVKVQENLNLDVWRFTGFYGSPYLHERDESWNTLLRLGEDQSLPWLVSGDFNEILYSFEKKGGLTRSKSRMEEFRMVLESCRLSDIGFTRPWFI